LAIASDATSSQIKKAYHKRALQYHPDKISKDATENEVQDAKLKFQAVSITYQILSDDERRKEYDQSGELVDDSEDDFVASEGFAQWEQFFKTVFGGINLDDIDKFTEKYKESEEEEMDVLKYYKVCKGDLSKMISCVMCSDKFDKGRWVKNYIEPAIQRGDVPRYEALGKTMTIDDEEDEVDDIEDVEEDEQDENNTRGGNGSNGKKRLAAKRKGGKGAPSSKKGPKDTASKKKTKISKEAQEMIAEGLVAQIRGRQNGSLAKRAEAFDSLISNNGKSNAKKGGKGKAQCDDIPDDEFEKIQARLEANRSKGKRRWKQKWWAAKRPFCIFSTLSNLALLSNRCSMFVSFTPSRSRPEWFR